MAALGVHQHRVDAVRVALPLPPEALGAAGEVGAVAPLQHDALDDRVGRRGAQRGEVVAGREGQERREVDARRVEGRDQGFERGAALGEGERAQVAVPELQQVVGAQVRRVAAQVGGRDRLAVQPLLQVGEAGDRRRRPAGGRAARRRARRRRSAPRRGRGRRRRCRRRCASRAGGGRPRRRPGRGCRPTSIRRRSRRGRGGRGRRPRARARASPGGTARRRPAPGGRRRRSARRRARRRAASSPCQTSSISPTSRPPRSASAALARRAETPTRRPPVTSFRSAKRPEASRRSSRRSTTCGASRREVARRVSTTSPSDGVVGRAGRRPDQRDGLGEVADEVVGEREELGVDAGGGDVAQQRRLDRGDVEAAGQRGERPAAVGVGRGPQVVGDQPELGVARRREGEAFEEIGEAAHGARLPRSRARRERRHGGRLCLSTKDSGGLRRGFLLGMLRFRSRSGRSVARGRTCQRRCRPIARGREWHATSTSPRCARS